MAGDRGFKSRRIGGVRGVQEAGEERAVSWIPKGVENQEKKDFWCNVAKYFAVATKQRGLSLGVTGSTKPSPHPPPLSIMELSSCVKFY